MKKLNFNEIALRIVSVALGIFLWYIVLNTANPIETRNITVPLEILNERTLDRNSLGLTGEAVPENINIIIKGRKNDLEKLLPNSISAFVDFNAIADDAEEALDVGISNRDEKITVVAYEPATITLEVEKIVERTFPIEISVIGETAEGYKLINVSTNPEQISVKGFKSEIDEIDSVIVQFELNNANRDRSMTKYLLFLNNRGEEIQAFSRTFTAGLQATLGKEAPVLVTFEGSPADGYYFDGVESNVSAVYLTGPFDVVSKINEVKTQPVDITGLKEGRLVDLEPMLANNISIVLVEGEMTAFVRILKYMTRTMIYRKNDILLTGADYIDNIYEVVTDSIEVTVKGKAPVLDSLLKTDINILMDVEKFAPGLHKVQLEFEYSKDIEIIGTYNATVVITSRPVETAPEQSVQE